MPWGIDHEDGEFKELLRQSLSSGGSQRRMKVVHLHPLLRAAHGLLTSVSGLCLNRVILGRDG